MVYQNGKAVTISQASASSGLAQDIYSTEEQVIGRWIDGRPLYRICIITETVNNGKNYIWSDVPRTIVPIRYWGTVFGANVGLTSVMYIPSCTDPNGTMEFYNDRIEYNLNNNNTAGHPMVTCVEYIKTTDEATILDNTTYLSGYLASINRSDSTFRINLEDTMSPSVLPVTTSISNNEEVITDV